MEVAPHGFCTLGGDRIANAFTERIVQNSIYRNVVSDNGVPIVRWEIRLKEPKLLTIIDELGVAVGGCGALRPLRSTEYIGNVRTSQGSVAELVDNRIDGVDGFVGVWDGAPCKVQSES